MILKILFYLGLTQLVAGSIFRIDRAFDIIEPDGVKAIEREMSTPASDTSAVTTGGINEKNQSYAEQVLGDLIENNAVVNFAMKRGDKPQRINRPNVGQTIDDRISEILDRKKQKLNESLEKGAQKVLNKTGENVIWVQVKGVQGLDVTETVEKEAKPVPEFFTNAYNKVIHLFSTKKTNLQEIADTKEAVDHMTHEKNDEIFERTKDSTMMKDFETNTTGGSATLPDMESTTASFAEESLPETTFIDLLANTINEIGSQLIPKDQPNTTGADSAGNTIESDSSTLMEEPMPTTSFPFYELISTSQVSPQMISNKVSQVDKIPEPILISNSQNSGQISAGEITEISLKPEMIPVEPFSPTFSTKKPTSRPILFVSKQTPSRWVLNTKTTAKMTPTKTSGLGALLQRFGSSTTPRASTASTASTLYPYSFETPISTERSPLLGEIILKTSTTTNVEEKGIDDEVTFDSTKPTKKTRRPTKPKGRRPPIPTPTPTTMTTQKQAPVTLATEPVKNPWNENKEGTKESLENIQNFLSQFGVTLRPNEQPNDEAAFPMDRHPTTEAAVMRTTILADDEEFKTEAAQPLPTLTSYWKRTTTAPPATPDMTRINSELQDANLISTTDPESKLVKISIFTADCHAEKSVLMLFKKSQKVMISIDATGTEETVDDSESLKKTEEKEVQKRPVNGVELVLPHNGAELLTTSLNNTVNKTIAGTKDEKKSEEETNLVSSTTPASTKTTRARATRSTTTRRTRTTTTRRTKPSRVRGTKKPIDYDAEQDFLTTPTRKIKRRRTKGKKKSNSKSKRRNAAQVQAAQALKAVQKTASTAQLTPVATQVDKN